VYKTESVVISCNGTEAIIAKEDIMRINNSCPKKNQNRIPSFLDGARKEAKEPLAKLNARDESHSLIHYSHEQAR